MRMVNVLLCGVVLLAGTAAAQPGVGEDVLFEEVDGLVAVEAEHYFKQTLDDVRRWYRTSADHTPDVGADADPNHAAGASGGVYLEALPDTRQTHGDKLIVGENFSNQPGKMGILHYKVRFNTPGKYYVWGRIYSTGTEDNGLHVGLDGRWPESGRRMQWTAKHKWAWASKQRTKQVHSGVPGLLFIEIPEPGEYEIQFAMREDGTEFDKWLMTTDSDFVPEHTGPEPRLAARASTGAAVDAPAARQQQPRERDGDGSVSINGVMKRWHKVTLDLAGPFARESDTNPNPFRDCRMRVTFRHASGEPSYTAPGYFAADGESSQTSAEAGNVWRAHLSPDKAGRWTYSVSFLRGAGAALGGEGTPVAPFDGATGTFEIAPTDKTGRDLRGRGRLAYVGRHHLRFQGDGTYFMKAGADAPETLLAYEDFDGTQTHKRPLKSWQPHLRDWRQGDPTWQGGKGKGLIGAINYLSRTGANAFSFLTYNAGGDGDNVWPHVSRDDKLHFDVSKLEQWGLVFDHATTRGMYLHFKLQETENDDLKGPGKDQALDGGDLGPQRKLYLREIVARFGHNLALNWNLGEENTQSTQQQRAMAEYLRAIDPYDHPIVMHTYPGQQDSVYRPLLGDASPLTGVSLQNSNVRDTHKQTVKWVRASAEAGKPWVVAFDEAGNAQTGSAPPDPGYKGFAGHDDPSIHDTRKQVLWGNIMGGGAGVEYYFGYRLPENDLNAEDWRSREQSWRYVDIALTLLREHAIPFQDMAPADELVGDDAWCLAKAGEVYLVYLPDGGVTTLDLASQSGRYDLRWLNPRTGEAGEPRQITAGAGVELNAPDDQDWLALLRRRPRD